MFPTSLGPEPCTQTEARKAKLYQGEGGAYSFLKGVDEVLQVNVIPVGSDVALEELPEPVPHPVLEQEGQHGYGQLQEKDEHNGTAELQGDKHRSRSHYTSGLPARRASLDDPEPLPAANSTSSAPKRLTLESGESHVISWVLWATHPYSHCCIVGKSQMSESIRKLQDNERTNHLL